jgi:hypothetical protein
MPPGPIAFAIKPGLLSHPGHGQKPVSSAGRFKLWLYGLALGASWVPEPPAGKGDYTAGRSGCVGGPGFFTSRLRAETGRMIRARRPTRTTDQADSASTPVMAKNASGLYTANASRDSARRTVTSYWKLSP